MQELGDTADGGSRARGVAHAANLVGLASVWALATLGDLQAWAVLLLASLFYTGNLLAVRRKPIDRPGGPGVGAWTAVVLLGASVAAFGLVATVVALLPFASVNVEVGPEVLLFYAPLVAAVAATLHVLRPWRLVRPGPWFSPPLLLLALGCFLVIVTDPVADVAARWMFGPPEPTGPFDAWHDREEARDVAYPLAFRVWTVWVALSVVRGLLLEHRERCAGGVAGPRSA